MADKYIIEAPGGVELEVEFDQPPTQADILAKVRAYGDAVAKREQDRLTQGPQGSATSRFVSNAAEVVNPLAIAKGLYQAVRHPLNTAMGIANASIDQGRQSIDAFKRGDYLESVGRAGATLPLIGPAAAEAGDQIGRGDVAGGLGRGLALLATVNPAATVRGAGRIITPVASRIPKGGALATRLDDIARNKLTNTIAPRGRSENILRMTRQVNDDANALLREPGLTAWTPEGYQGKLGGKLDEARTAFDDAADARLRGRPMDVPGILDDLTQAQRRYVAESVEGSRLSPGQIGASTPVRTGTNTSFAAHPGEMSPPQSSPIVRGTPQPITRAETGTAFFTPQPSVVDRPIGRTPLTVTDTSTGMPPTRPNRISGAAEPRVSVSTPAREAIGQDVIPPQLRPGYDVLNRSIEDVQRLAGRHDIAHYDALATIKRGLDIDAAKEYTPSVNANFLADRQVGLAASRGAGAIRDRLAVADPMTAAANQQLHRFKGPYDASVARAEIDSASPSVGRRIFQRMAGATAGAAMGGVGGATAGALVGPAFEQMLSALPTTQIKQARGLTKVADTLRGQNTLSGATASTKLRAALLARLLAGQTSPNEDDGQAGMLK